MIEKDVTGKKGEIAATKFLEKLGYKILATNYKKYVGEIDIVAKDKEYFVFIEVKARMNKQFGLPREAVTRQKQSKIRRTAEQFLIEKKSYPAFMRFDVIEIFSGEVKEHIINAF